MLQGLAILTQRMMPGRRIVGGVEDRPFEKWLHKTELGNESANAARTLEHCRQSCQCIEDGFVLMADRWIKPTIGPDVIGIKTWAKGADLMRKGT